MRLEQRFSPQTFQVLLLYMVYGMLPAPFVLDSQALVELWLGAENFFA